MDTRRPGDITSTRWTMRYVRRHFWEAALKNETKQSIWSGSIGLIVTVFALAMGFAPTAWEPWKQFLFYVLLAGALVLGLRLLLFLIVAPAHVYYEQQAIIDFHVSQKQDARSLFTPDSRGWKAVLYILNQTDFGIGKKESEIVEALRWGAESGDVTIWATPIGKKGEVKIKPELLQDHALRLRPQNDGGIGNLADAVNPGLFGPGVDYHTPRVCMKQIETLWPRDIGWEFNTDYRSRLESEWRDMIYACEDWVKKNPQAPPNDMIAYLNTLPGGISFSPYQSTRDVSFPWQGRKAFTDPIDHLAIIAFEATLICSQWDPASKDLFYTDETKLRRLPKSEG